MRYERQGLSDIAQVNGCNRDRRRAIQVCHRYYAGDVSNRDPEALIDVTQVSKWNTNERIQVSQVSHGICETGRTIKCMGLLQIIKERMQLKLRCYTRDT